VSIRARADAASEQSGAEADSALSETDQCKVRKHTNSRFAYSSESRTFPMLGRPKKPLSAAGRDDAVHRVKQAARQSEWPVSRGGLNQESDHNKHNDPGQSGHKPQQPGPAEQKQ
jgi:hypothetical protein